MLIKFLFQNIKRGIFRSVIFLYLKIDFHISRFSTLKKKKQIESTAKKNMFLIELKSLEDLKNLKKVILWPNKENL